MSGGPIMSTSTVMPLQSFIAGRWIGAEPVYEIARFETLNRAL